MAKPRRTRGGGPKAYADLCENCEPMVRSSSTSKLSQVVHSQIMATNNILVL